MWEHTAAISSIKRGFDHLPSRALSQPRFRLDRCENGQMVHLSLCNYFDADDRDWLFDWGLTDRRAHSVNRTRRNGKELIECPSMPLIH